MSNALAAQVEDEEQGTEGLSEAVIQQFYTAAMAAGSTGSTDLDTLLQKGLYGEKLPKELRGQKAANAFQQAFDLIGGIPRLALWADKNPSAFYTLYSKLIPSSVKADVNATIKIEAPWMSPNRLSYQDKPPLAEVVDVQAKPTAPKET